MSDIPQHDIENNDKQPHEKPRASKSLVLPLIGAMLIAGMVSVLLPSIDPQAPLGDIEKRVIGEHPALDRAKCDAVMADSFPQYFPVVSGCAQAFNPVAMRTLGYRAFVGAGETPRDREAAFAWLKRAKAAGDKEASKLLNDLEDSHPSDKDFAILSKEVDKSLDCKRFPEFAYACGEVKLKQFKENNEEACLAYMKGDGVVADFHKATEVCEEAYEKKESNSLRDLRDEAVRLKSWHAQFAAANNENMDDPQARELHYRQFHAVSRVWRKYCLPFGKDIPGCESKPAEGFFVLDIKDKLPKPSETVKEPTTNAETPASASPKQAAGSPIDSLINEASKSSSVQKTDEPTQQ